MDCSELIYGCFLIIYLSKSICHLPEWRKHSSVENSIDQINYDSVSNSRPDLSNSRPDFTNFRPDLLSRSLIRVSWQAKRLNLLAKLVANRTVTNRTCYKSHFCRRTSSHFISRTSNSRACSGRTSNSLASTKRTLNITEHFNCQCSCQTSNSFNY